MRSRTQILAATRELIAAEGFAAVNIAAVAAAAGVSRQTIYSIFHTREELVSQAVAQVAVEALDEVRARLAETATAADYIVELLVAGRRETRRQPVMSALLQAELGNPLFDEGMMRRARPVVAELLGDLPQPVADFDGLVEMVTRLGLTIVLFESDGLERDEALRGFLRRWLAPAVVPET